MAYKKRLTKRNSIKAKKFNPPKGKWIAAHAIRFLKDGAVQILK
jgi:hypothetical protein